MINRFHLYSFSTFSVAYSWLLPPPVFLITPSSSSSSSCSLLIQLRRLPRNPEAVPQRRYPVHPRCQPLDSRRQTLRFHQLHHLLPSILAASSVRLWTFFMLDTVSVRPSKTEGAESAASAGASVTINDACICQHWTKLTLIQQSDHTF